MSHDKITKEMKYEEMCFYSRHYICVNVRIFYFIYKFSIYFFNFISAAMVGSLTIGTTFLLSPVSGVLTDRIGLKRTTFIGGVLMTSGMMLSSVLYYNIYFLYVTYGLMFGLGAALAYTPTIAILGHYFKRHLGIVSGFVTSGSSIFTVILPKILEKLLEYGMPTACIAMGISSTIVILCALIYKPLQLPPPPPKRKMGQSSLSIAKMHLKSLVHVDNFKKRRYIIWIISLPIALIGYFVPYAHLVKYVKITYPGSDSSYPIMCIGLTSGLGRLFFGFIADYKWVNRIFLQQMSFVLMGLFTIAIPMVDSYTMLLIICLGIGIFDGCFISLLGPVAYGNIQIKHNQSKLAQILSYEFSMFQSDLCGPKGATQAIGFLLGLCSLPITSGAPIAGFLFDQSQSYYTSFILSGIPWLIGAVLMTLMHFVRDERRDVCDKNAEDQVNKLLNKPAWTEGICHSINFHF